MVIDIVLLFESHYTITMQLLRWIPFIPVDISSLKEVDFG